MKTFALLALIIVSGGFASTASTNNIYSIDFKNFHYRPSCLRLANTPAKVEQWQLSGSSESVVVTNGVYQSNKPDDPIDFRIFKIAYGDLTGDSNDMAIVLTICNTGGSGDFSEGFVYGMVNDQPKLLAVISGGDRAYGGIKSAMIEQGTLRVEHYGTNGGACCPEWIETTNYQFRDGKLVQARMKRRTKYVERN